MRSLTIVLMVRHKIVRLAFVALAVLTASSCWAQPQYTINTFAGGAPPATPGAGTSLSLGNPTGLALDSAGNIYFSSQQSIFKLDSSGNVTRIAGNARRGYSGDGGPGPSAQLNNPWGVAVDAAGNVYIADQSNNVVRVVTAGGTITTVAATKTGQLSGPLGVAVNRAGNLYIADSGSNVIREVSSSGVMTTIAGSGKPGFAGDGGPASSAQLNNPNGLAVDAAGNVYIADTSNNRVRKVTSSGVISTVAGTGTSGFSGDNGPATNAQLRSPASVTVDAAGNFYIADNFNRVRKVNSSGVISTVAGNGSFGYTGDGVAATTAALNSPSGIAVDAAGNLYIADTSNNRVRKVVAASGAISTIAGNGTNNFSGDGGPATSAQMNSPFGVTQDSSGNLYISDSGNNRIRKVTTSGIISTFAGNGASGFSGDGGLAASAQLSGPAGLAVDAAGNLYIADVNNNRIRKVTPAGIISTVAGSSSQGFAGDGGPATSAKLTLPEGVAVDATGNLYIADMFNNRIRMVTGGTISTIAGNGQQGFSGDGGPATGASLNNPQGVAVDASGNLYIADTRNSVIRKVALTGVISTVAGTGGLAGFSGDGGPATSSFLNFPSAVAVDATGNLYISDTNNSRIRYVAASSSIGTDSAHSPRGQGTGTISTIGGNAQPGYSGDAGPATSASINRPCGVFVLTKNGTIYYVDQYGNAIRVMTVTLCSYFISPGGRTYGALGAVADSFTVTAPSGCTYSATTTNDFISIAPSSNQGLVIFGVAAFPSSPNSPVSTRVGTIGITGTGGPGSAGEGGTFTVTQTSCTYQWEPQILKFGSNGGDLTVNVFTSDPSCPWTVDTPNYWISLRAPARERATARLPSRRRCPAQ